MTEKEFHVAEVTRRLTLLTISYLRVFEVKLSFLHNTLFILALVL